jgi:hypothetical protein
VLALAAALLLAVAAGWWLRGLVTRDSRLATGSQITRAEPLPFETEVASLRAAMNDLEKALVVDGRLPAPLSESFKRDLRTLEAAITEASAALPRRSYQRRRARAVPRRVPPQARGAPARGCGLLRKLIVRALLLSLLLPATLPAQQKLSSGFQLDADGSLRIQVSVGTVRIIAWDRDSVSVTGTIEPGGGSYYGGGRGRAGKLGIETRDQSGTGPGADVEIRVPAHARLWVKTVAASVNVEGVLGEVDCISVAGSLRIEGQPKVLSAETMDGLVTVEGASGVMRIRTGGGNVSVRGPGGDITASSVGGSIDVTTDKLERARLESVTGAVRFTGTSCGRRARGRDPLGRCDAALSRWTGRGGDDGLRRGPGFNKLTPKGSAQPKGRPRCSSREKVARRSRRARSRGT